MELKLLAIGDVVADCGVAMIRRHLARLIRQTGADFTVVNGENASVLGITQQQAETIFDAGANVITMGNHTFGRREIADYLDSCPQMLRPANLPPQQPGVGWNCYETNFGEVAVVDLIGRCGMDYTPDNPFLLIEKILPKIKTNLIFVELHAEATSEKLAMGYMLDGRISAFWGTHTHVPTADNQILPKGTGYVTDLGMTGPKNSVLGIRPDLSIARFRGDLAGRYQPAPGAGKIEGVLFTIDSATGRCLHTERIGVIDETPPRR